MSSTPFKEENEQVVQPLDDNLESGKETNNPGQESLDQTPEQQPVEPIEPTDRADRTEPPAQRSNYPTFMDLVAIFGVLVLTQVVGFVLVNLILPSALPSISYEMSQAWTLLIVQLFAMISTVIFIVVMRRRRKAEKISLKFSIKGFDPSILLGGIVMILSMSVVLEPLLSLLPAPPSIEARGWPLLLSVVFFAPLFEEIISRGFVLESLRVKSGGLVALLVSSLFFGLIHIDPAMVVNAFFMGLILGYIYLRSGSLIAPIFLHAFNNAIGYLLIVVGMDDAMLRDLIKNDSIYYVVYSVAALLLIASTVMCARKFRIITAANQSKESGAEENIIEEE